MTELPEGFDLRGVHCYQSKDDPSLFYYIPGDPSPEKSPTGEPTLLLSLSDQGGMLQLGTHWEADAALLKELQKSIAGRFPDLDPALIRLTAAPASVEDVTLTLGDGSGQDTELQKVSSSGFPPYAALFNVPLTAEQKAHTASAVNGRTGLLKVNYHLTLPTQVTVCTTIAGDVSTDIAELDTDATLDDCRTRIEAALAQGRLHMEQSGSDSAPQELREKSEQMAREKAAKLLHQMTQKTENIANIPDAANLKATMSLTRSITLPLTRSTDIGSWFPGGVNTKHLLVLPGTSTTTAGEPPSTKPAAVRIGFDLPRDVPIAFIVVKRGQAQAVLRGPDFNPITLPAGGADEPLTVTTNYTDGGAPFEMTLSSPQAEGWVLAPADLGLVKVELDAVACKEAGAKQGQIRVQYKPTGQGSQDDRIVKFRFGDWTDNWYIVTRSADLGGVIEYEWQETGADDTVVKRPTVTTSSPLLKIEPDLESPEEISKLKTE